MPSPPRRRPRRGRRPCARSWKSTWTGWRIAGRAPTPSVAVGACHTIERLTPALLDKPVSQITEADIFAFRRARVEQSATAVRSTGGSGRVAREGGARESQAGGTGGEGRGESRDETQHDQSGSADAARGAQTCDPRLSVSGRRVFPGGRDARSLAAPEEAGARTMRSVPRNRPAGRADADALSEVRTYAWRTCFWTRAW